jgi:hypothetical protein
MFIYFDNEIMNLLEYRAITFNDKLQNIYFFSRHPSIDTRKFHFPKVRCDDYLELKNRILKISKAREDLEEDTLDD